MMLELYTSTGIACASLSFIGLTSVVIWSWLTAFELSFDEVIRGATLIFFAAFVSSALVFIWPLAMFVLFLTALREIL